MNANRRPHKHTSSANRSQKHQSHSVSPAEPHSPHDHQRQVNGLTEQERQPTEVSSRRYIQAQCEIFIHTQATWEEEYVREYNLPRQASQSSFIQTSADAPEDLPPSYSEAAQQTQQAQQVEQRETSPSVVKRKKKQIRARNYEGALRFLAGRGRLGAA